LQPLLPGLALAESQQQAMLLALAQIFRLCVLRNARFGPLLGRGSKPAVLGIQCILLHLQTNVHAPP
jgi:hypothetical protein